MSKVSSQQSRNTGLGARQLMNSEFSIELNKLRNEFKTHENPDKYTESVKALFDKLRGADGAKGLRAVALLLPSILYPQDILRPAQLFSDVAVCLSPWTQHLAAEMSLNPRIRKHLSGGIAKRMTEAIYHSTPRSHRKGLATWATLTRELPLGDHPKIDEALYKLLGNKDPHVAILAAQGFSRTPKGYLQMAKIVGEETFSYPVRKSALNAMLRDISAESLKTLPPEVLIDVDKSMEKILRNSAVKTSFRREILETYFQSPSKTQLELLKEIVIDAMFGLGDKKDFFYRNIRRHIKASSPTLWDNNA